MEGVSNEAASIAGHLELDNLCWVYDNNHITIDGKTKLAYEDDVAARFQGYGWNVTRVGDANDTELIAAAFEEFKARGGPPDPGHRRQPHRLGLAAQARHRRRPRRAARRGGGAGDEARLRLARGRPVPRPRRGQGALRRRGSAGAAPSCAPNGRRGSPLTRSRAPSSPPRSRLRRGASCPTGWDADIPSFDPDEKGIATRKASQQGRERDRRAPALAARRLGRPHRLDLGAALRSTAPPTSSPAPTTAASSTTASASTSRRRSPTASRSPSCGRSGRPTSPSPTTPGRRSGSRR